jgi:hypothetical protein
MKKFRMAIFWLPAFLLALFFLTACVSPYQIPQRHAVQSKTLQNPSATLALTLDDANWTALKQIPPEIHDDVWDYARKYSIPFASWGFDPVNNEIFLFAGDFHDPNAIRDLQGKKIGNYTIHIFNGTELKMAEPEVRTYFTGLMKKPECQIEDIDLVTRTDRPYILLYYNMSTPQNQYFQNRYYKGWKVSTVIKEEGLNVSHAMNS